MFKRKKTYIYGTDPNRLVKLTEDEAYAVNNLRLKELKDADGQPTGRFTSNLTRKQMEDYDRAASILNADIAARGPVDCDVPDDEFEDFDIVRLKK